MLREAVRQRSAQTRLAGFSFIGIMLGVATLIIVMAVMNGFRTELVSRILGINGHMIVQAVDQPLSDYAGLAERFAAVPGVTMALPLVEGQTLASGRQGAGTGALVRGIRPDDLTKLTVVSSNIRQGDMVGFAAASYQRGVPFIQVPTTLLSQVDSSVGGKTAINHPLGKNMIGAFYQPVRVVCDLDTLKTLPERELSAGLAEVIKYGPIADMDFLGWIEANMDLLMQRDRQALAHAVKRSCEIKAWVVGQDERESGLRAILNFGHTFGHAIEAGLGYGEWLHGEAVGCGMVMAADLSARLGLIDTATADRIIALIKRAGLPTRGPDLGADRYIELMQVDKKAEGGEIRFVVIGPLGSASMRGAPEGQRADVPWVSLVSEVNTKGVMMAPGYALGDRLEAMQAAVERIGLPPGYTTQVSGRGRELERAFREFLFAFLLSARTTLISLTAILSMASATAG